MGKKELPRSNHSTNRMAAWQNDPTMIDVRRRRSGQIQIRTWKSSQITTAGRTDGRICSIRNTGVALLAELVHTQQTTAAWILPAIEVSGL
jgi:hypothetical protein